MGARLRVSASLQELVLLWRIFGNGKSLPPKKIHAGTTVEVDLPLPLP